MTPPALRRTTTVDLLVPLVIVGITVYALLRVYYDSMPPLGYLLPAPIALLAVLEFVVARRVRAAVRHEPNARPMAALVIARCVALGKASSLVGAGLGGAAIALLARVIPDYSAFEAAAGDTRVGAVLLVACGLLVFAGLVLERSGIDPGSEQRRRESASG